MSEMTHTHTWRRILDNGRKTKTFACTNPRCTTTFPAELLVGKESQCPYCDQGFIVTREKLRKQGLLHCDNCSTKKKKVKALESGIDNILKTIGLEETV